MHRCHDANGNVTTIGYPGGVTATYTHDFADRQATLTVTTPAGTTDVIKTAGYLPSGPLTSLTLGNDAVENHLFDARYLPAAITLDAADDRTWAYTTDAVGNVTEIAEMGACPGDLTLSNQTVSDVEVFESCATLTAGPAFTVTATGDLTLRAATSVVLSDGFHVEAGGRLAIATDPTITGDLTKTYGYQDVDYFLQSADGPWGSQSWTYDKIGNRTSETDDGATEQYNYLANGSGGHTARLTSIDLDPTGTRDYGYTPAGHVASVTAGANAIAFDWDDAGRLDQAAGPNGTSAFLYDGRGFLRSAGDAATAGTVTPTYDSAGLLHSLLREPDGEPTRRYSIFYLAGRPVAQLATETGQPDRWWYLTTDHLGTPLVATDAVQATLWTNRFEPFGTDPWAGTSLGALENEMYLRFPGQWEDPVWQAAMLGAEGYYNVYRWYTPAVGRYSRPDPSPLGRNSASEYAFVNNSPITYFDPLGLLSCGCNDDCPSGEWTYTGWGASFAALGGISFSRGTFVCKDNARVRQPVKAICGLLGPILGGGVGFETSSPFLPSGCACNGEDLLGDDQTSVIGSAGPASATVSGCERKGPFSIGSRTLTFGGFKSTGAGLAWISCDVTRRDGWWDWDFSGGN